METYQLDCLEESRKKNYFKSKVTDLEKELNRLKVELSAITGEEASHQSSVGVSDPVTSQKFNSLDVAFAELF